MRGYLKALNSVVCACQAILLALPLPVLAVPAASPADLAQISKYEQIVFGKDSGGVSEETRLKALEQNIFGEVHKGRPADRLKAIAKIMGKGSGSLKLKPLAPILDTSITAQKSTGNQGAQLPEPSPPPLAPSYSSRNDNNYSSASPYSYSPLAGDNGGRSERNSSAGIYSDNVLARENGAKSDRAKNLLRQAISQYQAGNSAMAEQTFWQVLQMDSTNPDAHFSLGAIAESRGDFDGASQHYRQALQSSPDDAEIQQAVKALEDKTRDRKIAKQRQQEQQQQLAQQERQKAQLKRLSDDAALAYRNGKYDVAIRDLEQVAQQAPNDPDVQYALAQAYRGNGDIGRARYHIGQAIAQDPSNQMYRTVQKSIEQETGSRNSPPVANDPGNSQGRRTRYSPQYASASENDGPTGQLTPMQPESNPPRSMTEYGYASSGLGMAGLGGLLPGVVGMGFGLGSGRGDDDYGRGRGGSTRIKRAVEGSIAGAVTGAAMSAMFNHHPGSVKQGAIKGAVFGGMAGLIFGGF